MDSLRTPREFRRVYEEGRRYAADLLILYRRPAAGVTRVGLSVGRRVGTAVARNRVRRRLREVLRRIPLATGQEVVVAARPQAEAAPFGALRSELERLLGASGALRPSPDGTESASAAEGDG
jgi:ribonuclease P protein component